MMNRRDFSCSLPLHLTVIVKAGKITHSSCKHSSKKGKLSCSVEASAADEAVVDKVFAWLEDYTRKVPPRVTLPLKLPEARFCRTVLENLQEIPFGTTQSYKEIAERSGVPQGARAVGGACGANPILLFIPCHRVVKTSGEMGGFSSGLEIKRLLLSFEELLFGVR